MKFYSTNLNSEEVSFREALFRGQAPDKGLYMPHKIPKLTYKQISEFGKKEYWEIASAVMRKFINAKSISEEKLEEMCKSAYNFPVPIEKVGKFYVMRLDQGPTASFKDFAARMMARQMDYFCEKESRKLKILIATSGDTGGAVANAFYGSKNIEVTVLFPKTEVSNRQRMQMTTLGKNIRAISIDGKFDDCQALVKKAFSDPDTKNLSLSSANSINIGRLIPQSVYYFYAQSRLRDNVIFSVPSGNFGNLMGGLIAREMNLPVREFIVAVNENDEFPKFFENGWYCPVRPSKKCLSNAMNVGHPSNLARIFDLYEGHMDELGFVHKMPNKLKMDDDLYPISITDKRTIRVIQDVYRRTGKILEPHGAVAYAAARKITYKDDINYNMPIVCLETAHPAKFPDVVKKAIGINPELPESMKNLENKEENFIELDNDYNKFKEILLKHEI